MKSRTLLITAFLFISVQGEPAAVLAQNSAPAVDSKRVLRLFEQFKCDCSKEDWTRTLAGCFEPCVNRQKALVRELVAQGRDGKRPKLSDEEITQRMIDDAGTDKVLARPGVFPPGLLPYVIFSLLGCGVFLALRRMLRETSVQVDPLKEKVPDLDPGHKELEDRLEEELSRLRD